MACKSDLGGSSMILTRTITRTFWVALAVAPTLFLSLACGGSGTAPPAGPSVTSFVPAAASITAGGSTTLTAVFNGGTGSIDHGVGTVTSGAAVSVSPSITTTYDLTVTGTGGTASTQATVTVIPAGPVITSFGAAPSTLTAGGSTELTAVFTGGTGSVDHAVGAVASGAPISVNPSETTTYLLTVTGAGGTATVQTTVSVTPLAVPAPALKIASAFSGVIGGQIELPVSITGTGWGTRDIPLTLIGAPDGIQGTGTIVADTWGAYLTLTIDAAVLPATYAFQVQGTDGTVTQTARVALTTSLPAALPVITSFTPSATSVDPLSRAAQDRSTRTGT